MKPAVPVNRYLAFFGMAAGVCAIDLATKHWAFARFGPPNASDVWWLWDGVFGFQTSLNPGALFGMGQGLWPAFAALSVGAAGGILFWLFVVGAARDWLLTLALGMVTGGICGNLYDRLGFAEIVPGRPVHAVRDFVLMVAGDWQWPNYNLADASLVCGVGLLLWHSVRGEEKAEEEKTDGTEP